MKYMLDTNICIYAIKRNLNTIRKIIACDPEDICISSITLSELIYGIEKSSRPEQNRVALIQFLAPISILAYGCDAANEYGRVRSSLEKSGTPIGSMDMLIASHALSEDLTLITNNEKEFRRIPQLKVENWT